MKPETFVLFKRALVGDVDKEAFERVRAFESQDVIHKIDLVLERSKPEPWTFDTSPFKEQFRTGDPRARLDRVVLTSLLSFAAIASHERFVRSLYMTGSFEGSDGWQDLIKILFYSVVTIAYDAKWTSERHLQLDSCLRRLGSGRPEALREWLSDSMDISVLDAEPAEREFASYAFHRTLEFGPYLWRLLHWMAELFPHRSGDDARLAKTLWRTFVVESLHRLLRCPHCIEHYKSLVPEYRAQIEDGTDSELGRCFFNLHNRVNRDNFKPSYSESEYEEDLRFMGLTK